MIVLGFGSLGLNKSIMYDFKAYNVYSVEENATTCTQSSLPFTKNHN